MQVPIYPILWRGIREAYFSWVPPVSPRAAVGAIRSSMEDSLAEDLRDAWDYMSKSGFVTSLGAMLLQGDASDSEPRAKCSGPALSKHPRRSSTSPIPIHMHIDPWSNSCSQYLVPWSVGRANRDA